MTKSSFAKLVVFAAAVGGAFLLGRLSRPMDSASTPPPLLRPASPRVLVAEPLDSVTPPRTDPEPMAAPPPATRWATALWLRKAGIHFSGWAIAFDRVGPQLVGFFDLTPAETATLDAAVARAAHRMAELADLNASGQVDAAKGKLIVDVAAYPEEGGRVYDELLGQFRSVLGPERFAYFGTFFGDNFDRSYESFGLHRLRYEVGLTPIATSQGRPVFRIERSFVVGDGTGSGRSDGQVPLDQLIKYNPILKRFLPPALAEAAK